MPKTPSTQSSRITDRAELIHLRHSARRFTERAGQWLRQSGVKVRLLAVLLVLPTPLLAGCTHHEAPQPRSVSATVTGTIVEGNRGGPLRLGDPAPLRNASVRLTLGKRTFEAHADRDGRFRVVVPPGRHAVQGKLDRHPALACNADHEVFAIAGKPVDITVPVTVACIIMR